MYTFPNEPDPELRKLYPKLTDEELLEVEQNLERYLEIVLRIAERAALRQTWPAW